jgi:hypothetical protein
LRREWLGADDEGVLGAGIKPTTRYARKEAARSEQTAAVSQSSAMLVLALPRRTSEMCEKSILRKLLYQLVSVVRQLL